MSENKQITKQSYIWDKVFKNGTSKICGRKPLKNLKWYFLLKQLWYQIGNPTLEIRLGNQSNNSRLNWTIVLGYNKKVSFFDVAISLFTFLIKQNSYLINKKETENGKFEGLLRDQKHYIIQRVIISTMP